MLSLIIQVFIVLLSFSESLATKYKFLKDASCMVRPTLMFYIQKYVSKKDKNIKVFNTNTNKMKLKQWQNIFHVIVNANLIVQHLTQI